MISVQAETAEQAWKQCFASLFRKGYPLDINGFYRNESAAIEIQNIDVGLYSQNFPMDKPVIDDICNYLVAGTGEIEHDWSKIYRQRLFEEKDHIQNIINTLRAWPDCPRAQIAVWKNTDIDSNKIAPCLQLLWFKVINSQLCLHVHMRTSDCYGKLLMNFNEFIAIQKHVATELEIDHGAYTHFVDSLHFHTKDREDVDKLFSILERLA